ncbi:MULTISPECIES: pyridoxamine 5'-phosphate oxidase family protein [Streptomyces]|uniref:Pyridoxamine 5'-phosphate oxidase family protein n=1 Tax=Streptomyces chilikensis TaxID=1194079 RepID=A0ABV3EST5_9ACTN|nr:MULTISPECIES: pyridoxamine 5'-phosphate oxidase family protein [Streptomyces]MDH6224060.1 putative pyridoxine 5'-phosphate oxidase superfamily flavin-nucleotide-binding protein [Streptomyces sp. MJP52]
MATYHRGEIAVQERAGLARQAEFSLGGIGGSIPPVAEDFLAAQPLIVLGGTDHDGRVWTTQLTGETGFLRVPDPRTVVIDALPLPEDPLAGILTGGSAVRVGMIAVEPATRRRMRINGRARRDGDGLRVDLDQVIANCPKYLQKREYRRAGPGEDGTADRTVTDGTELGPAQQQAVRTADTFFVTTASDSGDADSSHRGGNPGFVQVLSPTLLRWPDYAGNAMFLTLGNLLLNASAGILVPDWETGATLHLSGSAHTVWDAEEIAGVPGAQRLVEFSVEAVREITAASPLRWTRPGYSRFNPPVR